MQESNWKDIGIFMINIVTAIPLRKSINGKRATGCCEHVFLVNIINYPISCSKTTLILYDLTVTDKKIRFFNHRISEIIEK